MARDKQIGIEQALGYIQHGTVLMVGGFLGCGAPNHLVEALLDTDARDLTIICNDSARPEFGVGKLIVNRRVKKLITSHIGTNPETGRQLSAGELEVELVPQGTFAERIRAGGAGLGGVLTPTGVGTLVQQGKQTIELQGKTYLIELPLRADVALIWARRADAGGNLCYEGSTRNSNTVMAMAADRVIAQSCEIVDIGQIDPNHVVVPGVFVDHLVEVRVP